MNKQAKILDTKAPFFTANGRKYYFSQKLSLARYEEFEKLQVKLAFDVDFESMFKHLRQAYNYLNDKKFADAAVKIYNIMSGIDEIRSEKRIHPALLMAALTINREDEDATTFDQKLQEEKIQDWRAEGYDPEGFFYYAVNSIKGFAQTYNGFIQENPGEKVNLKQ